MSPQQACYVRPPYSDLRCLSVRHLIPILLSGRNATGHARYCKPHPLVCAFVSSGLIATVSMGYAPATAQAQSSNTVRATTSNVAEGTHHFQIPATDLDHALGQFGQQAGVLIGVDSRLTLGRQSPGLSGNYSVAAALQALLEDTNLEALRRANGSYVLHERMAADAVTLATVRVQARRAADGTTEGTGSYTSRVTSVASKSDQSFRDVPQSVSVITRELLDNQQVEKVDEAMKLAPGITVQRLNNDTWNYYSRGFQITSMQIDGGAPLALGEYTYNSQQDLAFYDRVEIMRGASGLLGGMGDPGGIINLVRKKPLAEAALTIEQSFGRWNNYRSMVDATGPVTQDARVRARGVISYTDRDYFRDYRSTRSPAFYGVIEADLGQSTLLTLGSSYQHRTEKGSGDGVPRYLDGSDLGLPRGTSLTQPWAQARNTATEVFAELEHRLDNDWKLKTNLTHIDSSNQNTTAFVDGGIDPATGQGAYWGGGKYAMSNKQLLADISLSGDFSLLGRQHDFLIGADWQRVRSSWETGKPVDNWAVPVDVFNPNRWNPDMDVPFNLRYSPWGQEQKGLYGMLRLRPVNDLQVVMGARFSRYNYEQEVTSLTPDGTATPVSASDFSESALTPYGGLIYDLNDEWSTYASFAMIHKPQALLKSGPPPGNSLNPIKGKSYEMGVKGELLDGRLNTTVSLFNVERTGTGVQDPSYSKQNTPWSGSCCYLPQGKVISRGIDLEIGGEIAAGWQAHVGYTYNITKDRNNNNPYSSITPKHLLKVATVYTVPGSQDRWKVGGSAMVQSRHYVSGTVYDRVGKSSNYDFVQGGYATVNLMTSYQLNPQWTAKLNLSNVFDRHYYDKVGSVSGGNWYGEPRNWMLSLRGQF